MSVMLHEVMSAADKRAAALAAEVTGYLVLAVADQVAGAPRKVGFDEIALGEEGAVRVASAQPADDGEAEDSLRALLAEMLLVSSSVTPALRRAGQRAGGSGIDAFIRELEVALIPVNRSAAKRALSRLHRDVARAKAARPLEPYRSRGASPVVESKAKETANPTIAPPEPALASVELPLVMFGAADPVSQSEPAPKAEPDRSWLSPETIAVTEIAWPGRVFPRDPEPDPDPIVEEPIDDQTVIPIYVEEHCDVFFEVPLEETATPLLVDGQGREDDLPKLPEVPDLDVEPSPFPPLLVEQRPNTERETVPQPAVVRRAQRSEREEAESDAQKTPPLGTLITELEPPPWPLEETAPIALVTERARPLEVTAPLPVVLELVSDEATDRVPAADLLGPQEFTEKVPEAMDRALDLVARAFDESDVWDTIDAGWSPSPAPVAVTPSLPLSSSGGDWLEVAPELLLAGDPDCMPLSVEPAPVVEAQPIVADEPEPEAIIEAAPEAMPVVEAWPEPPPEVDCCPLDPSAQPPELLAIDFEPHEISESDAEADEAPIEPLTDFEANATPDDEPDFAPALDLELSPLPQIDVNSLETLAVLPRRPEVSGYAPPRYAPKQSDVDTLLTGFSVAEMRSERDLCRDLKTLAGIDATQPPPAVQLSETPPPVDLGDIDLAGESEASSSRTSSARVVAGAVSVALVLAGIGFGSIPTRAASAAGAATPPAPCAAELTVRELPAGSVARLRIGSSGKVAWPTRFAGKDAIFEGLVCGESVEVTVELAETGSWLVIPVAAENLLPASPEQSSLVQHAVIAR